VRVKHTEKVILCVRVRIGVELIGANFMQVAVKGERVCGSKGRRRKARNIQNMQCLVLVRQLVITETT